MISDSAELSRCRSEDAPAAVTHAAFPASVRPALAVPHVRALYLELRDYHQWEDAHSASLEVRREAVPAVGCVHAVHLEVPSVRALRPEAPDDRPSEVRQAAPAEVHYEAVRTVLCVAACDGVSTSDAAHTRVGRGNSHPNKSGARR